MRVTLRVLVAPLAAALLATAAAARPLPAQLPAPAAASPDPIHVGGYGSVVLHAPDDSGRTRVSEASLALLGSGTVATRLAWFVELDGVSSSRENFAGRQDDRRFDLARAYAEYTIADALRLRIGRFLTPIGAWNESHAEPLTWTAVRPLTTYRSFSKSVTGLLVAGQGTVAGRDAGYALYLAPGGLSIHDNDETAFTHALGTRLAIELAPGAWLGTSAALVRRSRPVGADTAEGGETGTGEPGDERREDQAERGLLGADARLRVWRAELSAEGTWLAPGAGAPTERGAFVQGVVPLVGTLYGVAQGEEFDAVGGRRARSASLGLTWRPRGWLTAKVERRAATPTDARVARGWFWSVSALF